MSSNQQILKIMNQKENITPEFRKWDKSNPFKVSEGYFETFEDRLMDRIKSDLQPAKKTTKIIQLLKPALGLAASFALVALLVYYPINHFLLKDQAKTETVDSTNLDQLDAYILSFSSFDEQTIINALFPEDQESEKQIDPDEMFAYLSSQFNEVEICSEFQN